MKERMKELYDLIRKYNHEYYINNNSIVDDYEYDKLFKELKMLEEKYPEFIEENSPVQSVDNNVDNRFKKVEHREVMLSLDNAFSSEDILKFDSDIRKVTSDFTYVCELKIDGLAMSFLYENNKFVQAVTRGNGQVGEDVTHNVINVDNLIKETSIDSFEVRGEVFVSKDEFNRLNDIQKQSGEKLFANPRNLASGTIRQLDSSVSKNRNIDAFIYGCVGLDFDSHYESLMFLKQLGFNVNEYVKKVDNVDEVLKYIEYFENRRFELPYETDGIVIKVNEYDVQEALGMSSRAPKWAIAYKYKAEQVETVVNDITFQVGRTGKITPVAELESVLVSGSTVSRATLHNENYIIEKGIHVGDTVIIHKAGEIIPEVVEVIKSSEDVIDFEMISNCPICNSELVKIDANHFCQNDFCPAKVSRNLSYFVSIGAMNIDGLGEKNIELLINEGFVSNIIDLYELKNHRDELVKIEGFGEKRVDTIIENLEKSKSNNLEQFIAGLGIKNVGKKIASVLVNEFGSLENLVNATYEQLEQIDEIGPVIATSFTEYMKSESFMHLYQYIQQNNFDFKVPNINKSSIYVDKKICVTGSFENYGRKDIEEYFKLQGAKIVSSVSKATDILIVGSKAGSKLDKAISYNVSIMNEEELYTEMEEKNE